MYSVYVPHGAGPMPLLGEPGHADLVRFLGGLPSGLPTPEAIVVVSAHYEAPVATVTSGGQPEMLFDYYGFPQEAYRFRYPAPGSPGLAAEIVACLEAAGVPATDDPARGYDHGTFVPLMIMAPQAQVPVVQVSLLASLDPRVHLDIGRALAGLAGRDVMLLGSGMSFHDMRAFRQPGPGTRAASERFHDWLVETLTAPGLTVGQRESRLAGWAQAPFGRECHPREEHLLPLHVCAAAGWAAGLEAQVAFDAPLLGHRVLGALWA